MLSFLALNYFSPFIFGTILAAIFTMLAALVNMEYTDKKYKTRIIGPRSANEMLYNKRSIKTHYVENEKLRLYNSILYNVQYLQYYLNFHNFN